jgi:hypothetical protein
LNKPRTDLILDDNPDQVEMLAMLLTDAGHRVRGSVRKLFFATLVRRTWMDTSCYKKRGRTPAKAALAA